MPPDPITRIYDRWLAGDQAAAGELFDLYSARLIALADRRLSEVVQRRVEGRDVVQSVFRTFFRRSGEGEFQIRSSDELWKLLVTITIRKAQSQARKHVAKKRNVGVESGGPSPEAMTREPGPAEAAILVEQIEALMTGGTPRDGEILGLRLAGHSRTEIAAKLGISRQTVYRSLNKLQQRLEKLLLGSA